MDRNEAIQRTIKVLREDWERQSGTLYQRQVEQALFFRKLNPHESLAVYDALAAVGIEVCDEEPEIAPPKEAAVGDDYSPNPRLLTKREEAELGRKVILAGQVASAISEGRSDLAPQFADIVRRGSEARDKMIVSNMRLVQKIARYYSICSELPVEDLAQEGMFGLMNAVDKFDPHLGFKFSTYAFHWIRQSITRAIADRGRLIRIPVHMVETLRKLSRAVRFLEKLNGGMEPTIEEIADRLGWELERTAFVYELSRSNAVSLDAQIEGHGGLSIIDSLSSQLPSPDEVALRLDLLDLMEECLEELPERQREILRMRFGFDSGYEMTLEQVGAMYGVTRERIRQIQKKAVEKVKKKAIKRGLMDYL